MLKRVLGILSYVGMVLVFGALLVRVRYPDYDQYAIYAIAKDRRVRSR